MSGASSPSLKKKRTNTLTNLFKRGKKGDPQTVIVMVDDKPVGEVDVDLSAFLSKLRAKIVANKLPMPDNYAYVNGGAMVRPAQEDSVRICDTVVAAEQSIVIQVISIQQVDPNAIESKSQTAVEAASSPRGRGALKRTKPKGNAVAAAIKHCTESEATAVATEAAVNACGGASALSTSSFEAIASAVTAMLAEKLESCADPEPAGEESEKLYKRDAVVDAGTALGSSLQATLPGGTPANDEKLHAVAHDDQGSRQYMEDKWTIAPSLGAMFGVAEPEPTYFYGVYDGHTGKLAAEYVRTHLHANVARNPNFATDLRQAITEAYAQTDAEFNAHAARQSLKDGTTVVTVVIRGSKLYVHWCGDSEALLCHRSRSIKLVDPHTPAREDEKKRIADNGGTVVWFGTWRVNGTLGVARSIGDYEHRDVVTAEPDSIERDITSDDSFIMLATDGLFDVFKHEEATMSTIHWINDPNRNSDAICNALVGESKRRKTKDNVTCMFVFLKDNPLPKMRPRRTAHPQVPTAECPLPSREEFDAAQQSAQ